MVRNLRKMSVSVEDIPLSMIGGMSSKLNKLLWVGAGSENGGRAEDNPFIKIQMTSTSRYRIIQKANSRVKIACHYAINSAKKPS